MTCPLREYENKKWVCGIAEQDCPEAKLDDFMYEACSTYNEYLGELYWR